MAFWTEHSLGFQMQTAFGAAADLATLEWLKVETPTFTPATEVTELDLLTGQIGAGPERIVGRRSGTLSFSIPLEGFKAGYTPSGDTPDNPGQAGVIPPWFCLLANALGSNVANVSTASEFLQGLHLSNSEYTSGGVTSATTSEITLDNSTASDKVLAGELIVTAASATTTTIQMGYVKAKAALGCTLFENSGTAVNSGSANVYGTANAWASDQCIAAHPLTFLWTGQNAALAYILQDCICDSITITWEAGAVPTAEFNFRVYDYRAAPDKGGLHVPDSFARIPQLVGTNNGRATIGGTAKCTLANCQWTWTATVTDIPCHTATQGISGVIISDPRVRATFSVLHDSADTVYDAAGNVITTGSGSHQWQSWLERGVTKSVGVYVGSRTGRIWAFLIPAGIITEVPAIEDRDGAVAYTVTVEAGSYTGDTTDTAETATNSPIDSIGRMSLA